MERRHLRVQPFAVRLNNDERHLVLLDNDLVLRGQSLSSLVNLLALGLEHFFQLRSQGLGDHLRRVAIREGLELGDDVLRVGKVELSIARFVQVPGPVPQLLDGVAHLGRILERRDQELGQFAFGQAHHRIRCRGERGHQQQVCRRDGLHFPGGVVHPLRTGATLGSDVAGDGVVQGAADPLDGSSGFSAVQIDVLKPDEVGVVRALGRPNGAGDQSHKADEVARLLIARIFAETGA